MKNRDVAKILNEIAELLEVQEDTFRPRAYRRAARSIEGLSESLYDILARNELEKIPGVGEGIAKKIQELLKTGKLQYLADLRKEVQPDIVELLRVPGIGPKIAKTLQEKLGIQNIEQLRKAVEDHKLRNLPGFGEKTEENIRKNLELVAKFRERMFIGKANPIAQEIVKKLQQDPSVEKIAVAGSLRRWMETIGDIDILVASRNSIPIMQAFVQLPSVQQVLAQGDTKSSVLLKEGIQADIRVVDSESFGAALQYFTGSKAHNIALRRLAQQHGWKLSEYGLFDTKTNQKIASQNEDEIYSRLGLPWIPPELREDQGEIQAGLRKRLPRLVQFDEIRGDLHIHTKWSDGANSIAEMAHAAKKLGYEYLGICDHSHRVRIAHGLDEVRLRTQIAEIRSINKKLQGFRVLAGIEVEILPDGSLDLPDAVLAETDFVIAALHYGTKASQDEMTHRLETAIRNRFVNVLAHPLGRIVGQRLAYQVDFTRLCKAAKQNEVYFEINALERLDLPDTYARQAKDEGVKLVINSDAHQIKQLNEMQYGVATARRGWVETTDVINTQSFKQLKKSFKHIH